VVTISAKTALNTERTQVNSDAHDKFPEQLQRALDQGLLKRLPRTFLPFTRQQLRDWDYLFPYERQSVMHLLLFLASLSQAESTALFREVVQVEERMGVRNWQFSVEEQTILNASLLARSPYYQEWRKAVQKVFDAAEEHAARENTAKASRHRLVLLVIPQKLPLDSTTVWRRWQSVGRAVKLEAKDAGGSQSPTQVLLGTPRAERRAGLLDIVTRRPGSTAADCWILDAGHELVESVLVNESFEPGSYPATLLSYERLSGFREQFSHEINTIQKDLSAADAVYDRLRKLDVTPWCPAEVAGVPVIREYLRSLYLSGNGALIYGNSFVEWGASEALRRARPDFLVARFGVRSKPKPFTSVAVFENPDKINPLPAVDDLPGSALDAQVLALYVWLAASRYDEYRTNTACVCLAESLSEAYVIAPPEFGLLREAQPVPFDRFRAAVADWLS
jgi:hypothetical protein